MYVIFVRFISEYLLYFLFFSTFCFLTRKDFKMVIKIVIGIVLAYGIRTIAGHLWFEPRPFMVNPQLLLYPTKETDSSFFSGHAIMAFAVAGSVFWRYRKFGTALFIMASMVSLGRVLAGLHYPHDVIAGALVGITISYLVERLSPKIIRRFKKRIDI